MTDATAALPALIPHEVLFGGSESTDPRISPDGTRLLYVASVDGVSNLFLRDVAGGSARQLTHDTGRGVHVAQWARDGRHVVFEQDTGGDENWHLYAVDVVSGETRTLVAIEGVRAQVVGSDASLPDVLCVAMNRDDPRWSDLFHVSVSTGEITKVASNDGFSRWAIDGALRARAAARPLDDGGAEVVVRESDDAPWRVVLRLASADAMYALFDVFPMRVSRDGRVLYLLTSHERDTAELVALDIATGAMRTVAGVAGGEVTWDVVLDPETLAPQLVGVATDRKRYVVTDAALQPDVDALRAVEDGDLSVVSRDDADEFWTVAYERDAGSSSFYLYRRSTRTAELLFHGQPALESYVLARMEPTTYRARDGLEVPVYLTFPPGVPRQDLPAVVLLHGGPANRYYWGFHPLAQLLANRGYLVAMPNFRGSIGFGKAFFTAGDRQWARAMHTDVVDCVEWIAAEGWANRERIGLWGTSYGGYETLVAVTHDPDLVTCAVAVVAPVNLVTLMKSIPPYWRAEREYFLRAIGDDDDELWDRSPLRLADRIKVPLLLFYGAEDPRVPVTEAEQLAAALESNGIPHEMHVIEGEGHSLGTAMSPDHRAAYVERLLAFYAEHLGGRPG